MSTPAQTPVPTEIRYNREARVLTVAFDDGNRFELSAEYLRVNSPSAEVQGHGPGQRKLVPGKSQVAINQIEPRGNYAVTLHFDDGHDTGIFSWEVLHRLGMQQDKLWPDYLEALESAGLNREPAPARDSHS